MFKKSAIFTQHALCCKARDLQFWEAVGRVPFDQRKFRKFEPVIFVEWKAPSTFYFEQALDQVGKQLVTQSGACSHTPRYFYEPLTLLKTLNFNADFFANTIIFKRNINPCI